MTKNTDFNKFIEKYATHPKVVEMKNYSHHGINRYDHSYRVAYHTYVITKKIKLNYKSATKAAMLHDFFHSEVQDDNSVKRLIAHPDYAVINAKKHFGINEMEEDIISKHMFPITFSPPKYVEGWIVDIVDDYVSIYERLLSVFKSLKFGLNANILLLLVIINSFFVI